jgi:hypothetical protein
VIEPCGDCRAQPTPARPGGPLNKLTHKDSCPTQARVRQYYVKQEELERLDAAADRWEEEEP